MFGLRVRHTMNHPDIAVSALVIQILQSTTITVIAMEWWCFQCLSAVRMKTFTKAEILSSTKRPRLMWIRLWRRTFYPIQALDTTDLETFAAIMRTSGST